MSHFFENPSETSLWAQTVGVSSLPVSRFLHKYTKQQVEDVILHGNETFSRKRIRRMLQTSEKWEGKDHQGL